MTSDAASARPAGNRTLGTPRHARPSINKADGQQRHGRLDLMVIRHSPGREKRTCASETTIIVPELADQAKHLAQRQKHVNKQLDALKKDDLATALKSMQKNLAEQTERLAKRAKDAAKMADSDGAKKKSDQAKGAGKSLSQAAEKAEMAAAAMNMGHINNPPKKSPPRVVLGPQSPPSESGGSPDGGQGTKGGGSNTGDGNSKGPSKSNNNENQTIGGKKNLGKATLTAEALLNQDRSPRNTPSGGSGTELQADAEELLRKGLAQLLADNNPLAKGFGGFGGGAPDEPVPPSPPKEFSAQSTAQDQDQPGGMSQGQSSGSPGGMNPSGRGAKLGRGQGNVVGWLGEMGISGDDWLRLPSHLRTEILQSTEDRAPREYRDLVRRYFQTMARRGSKQGTGQ